MWLEFQRAKRFDRVQKSFLELINFHEGTYMKSTSSPISQRVIVVIAIVDAQCFDRKGPVKSAYVHWYERRGPVAPAPE